MKTFLWLVAISAASSLSAGCGGESPEHPGSVGAHSEAIVGGFVETSRRYPIALRFEHPEFPGYMELRCSASLIGKRTVLTAAHCVEGESLPPPTEIAFGEDVYDPIATVPIASTVVHPDYLLEEGSVEADVAVVELAADAPEQPVGLVYETMPQGAGSKFVGPDITFVGYGTTEQGVPDHGTRRVVTYPLWTVGPATFQGFPVPDTAWLWVDPDMAEATCSGDSGGPAFFVEGGVERQLGVHSTSNCINAGLDAKIDQSMLSDFVQAHLDAFEGGDPCRSDGTCDAACQTGTELSDPDCAADHCGADGVCARSCVMPVDPDCAWDQTFCQSGDGACNPACSSFDDECAPFCGQDGVCVVACATPDPDCPAGTGGMGGAGAGGAGGEPATGGSGATGGGTGDAIEPEASDSDDGCGCRLAGRSTGGESGLGISVMLLAAFGALCRRARRRRSPPRAAHSVAP